MQFVLANIIGRKFVPMQHSIGSEVITLPTYNKVGLYFK